MNWKRAAEDDLRAYNRRKESLQTMMDHCQALQYGREAVSSTSVIIPEEGGFSQWEDKQLNSICEEKRLELTYAATRILVEGTERGLDRLNETERKVLDRFYINRINKHVESLMDELGYEKSQVYNIKDSALYKFTISLYGLPDY